MNETLRPQSFESVMLSVRQDADRCATHVFAYQAFNYRMNNPRLIDIINRHPAFWTGVMHAHLSAAFVAMGRLYETNADHITLAMLLNSARLNLHLFERRSLELRKKLAGLTSELAAAYVADAFEPSVRDLDEARKACAEARKTHLHCAKPIRDKVFAHTGQLTLVEQNKLFENFPARDFERLAVTPLRIHDALAGMYQNGLQPSLRAAESNVGQLVQNPPGKYLSTWHHIHVVAETSAFLDSLLEFDENAA